jgi:hypothetical protein
MLDNERDAYSDAHTGHASQAVVDLRGIERATGVTDAAADAISLLVDEYNRHIDHNETLRAYYDGNVVVGDYGVTAEIENDQTCHWPEKAVNDWAERINLERFTLPEDFDERLLRDVVERNNLVDNYNQHVPVKGLYGCMAATVNRRRDGHALIRFHGADTFTALPSPDFTDGVVAMGMAIARREYTSWSRHVMVPTIVNLHMPYNVGEFRQVADGEWVYSDGPMREELPTLYVFAHRRVGTVAPFGRTRITKFVRTLTDDAIRCMFHMQVSGAFYSMAKLWATGLTDEQFDAMMEEKKKFQLGRMLLLTANEQTDRDPNVGQLNGNSPQPFIDELRSLAMQFSGATGVPVSSLGIIQDNPSSAEAIASGREDICLIAQRDIAADKQTLQRVMMAAFAIEMNATTDELAGTGYDEVQAQFSDPILHTLSERSDWALKVNSMREGFGQTDVAARHMGISDAELEELKAEELRIMGEQMVAQMFSQPQMTDETDEEDEDDGSAPVAE